MTSLHFVIPGDLETLSGGFGYDRRIISGLRERGWNVTVRSLDPSFPIPTTSALNAAARALAEIPDNTLVVVDGLALGAMPAEAEREAARLKLIALVHHPLAAEQGLAPEIASALRVSEQQALAAVRHVVVTSVRTAAALHTYNVPPNRIAIVEPGTDRASLARGFGDSFVHLLCVAVYIPRKGHDVLFSALASITDADWRLTCVGSLRRDPATVERLRKHVRDHRLEDRIVLADEAAGAELDAYYDRADLFVLPTLYEGYGMVVSEALARGLPVIASATGGIPELLCGIDGRMAGLLVPPGDVRQLAEALAKSVNDRNLRDQLAAGARSVREQLPTWETSCERFADVLLARGFGP